MKLVDEVSESIIGYSVAVVNIEKSVKKIVRWIEESERKYFVCANPHSLIVADSDDDFKEAIQNADLVTPDGAGILLASWILGGAIGERVTGYDVFEGVMSQLNQKSGFTCFFLGSTEETLKKIVRRAEVDFPNVKVCGTYSPPYKTIFSREDNDAIVAEINRAKPDILWVGLTAPKQEKWINEHLDKIDVKFAGAIGAVFDFYVGNIKRSHSFFQNIGLEWLPRLLQEPRRLWKRSFVSSYLFLVKVLKQKYFTMISR
ncbi:MAG: WecB/TagA/CpsF family glycosyltransferase [Methylocystaceae bacterium]|nr:WecB/TagA/CpsF family glycosyltransferase [Methylocystaceae bacterium]